MNKVIKPKETGTFIVSLDPKNIIETGEFTHSLILRTEQMSPMGERIIKETRYDLKGNKNDRNMKDKR